MYTQTGVPARDRDHVLPIAPHQRMSIFQSRPDPRKTLRTPKLVRMGPEKVRTDVSRMKTRTTGSSRKPGSRSGSAKEIEDSGSESRHLLLGRSIGRHDKCCQTPPALLVTSLSLLSAKSRPEPNQERVGCKASETQKCRPCSDSIRLLVHPPGPDPNPHHDPE